MAEATPKRLLQAAKDLNIGIDRAVEALSRKGIAVENKPTTKLTGEQVSLLEKEFADDDDLPVDATATVAVEAPTEEPKPATPADTDSAPAAQ